MPRYAASGARIVRRTSRPGPDSQLMAAIDAHAAKVMQAQRDRDDTEAMAWTLEQRASQARLAAATAADRGPRKMLYEQAARLDIQASSARSALDAAEREIQQDMAVLRQLHGQARASLRP